MSARPKNDGEERGPDVEAVTSWATEQHHIASSTVQGQRSSETHKEMENLGQG